ncbi:MBL fold metallo-hydrolase [bacterium]|nr:MBL fold metallo-hydrolase [bacterium]
MSEAIERLIGGVDWLGHASFRLRGEKTVYIDPWKLRNAPRDGDLILITHTHYDHYSSEDIEKAVSEGAAVVAPAACRDKVTEPNTVFLAPGESADVAGLKVDAVRAYNTNKEFHPRDNDWLGYIVTLDGVRIYHSGDTDVIDEMRGLACDVALLTVSGTYVMTADEAVEAAGRIGPKVAIPMHWGDIVGGRADAEHFKVAAPCPVVLLDAQT